jgi:parallel beta-helix repeat protein
MKAINYNFQINTTGLLTSCISICKSLKNKMMRKLLFYILISALGIGFSFAQTSIPGGSVSGTWTLTGSPYLIQGDITIPDSQTLTVMPGVTVYFDGKFKLFVQGRILSIGTSTDSIIWTASDSFGWCGIRFDNTPANNDTSKFYYCKLQYGKGTSPFPGNNGGAFYLDSFSKVIISNSRITDCTASNNGGGIYCNYSNPIISNNTISNNLSSYHGGGIYCGKHSSPIISNNTISNNSSSYKGGGIYCASSSPDISNNIIYNNSANVGGGIICDDMCSPKISNNSITNNSAFNSGAGIYSYNSRPAIINNTITNNSTYGNGGGLYFSFSSPTITNNTIANNHAVQGGALYCFYYSTPILRNTILYGNTTSDSGQQVYLADENSDPNFYNCDVQGGTTQFGFSNGSFTGIYKNNIDANPLFIAPSDSSGIRFDGVMADWSLKSNSPCIDAGDSSGTYLPTDKAGNKREVNKIDIGAYEFQMNSYIGGMVFYDANSNLKKDQGEQGINGNLIEILPGPHFTCSDKKGLFNNYTDTGNITIKKVQNNGKFKYWHLSPGNPVQYNIHATLNMIDTNNNFAMIPTPNVKDSRIFLIGQTGYKVRPGRTESYSIAYENIGTATISSGTVNLNMDSKVNLQTSNPNYTSFTYPNASWNFTNLQPAEKRIVNLTMMIDTSLSIYDTIRYYVSILPTTDDSDLTNNYDTLKQRIATAIDPNDKQCSPEGNILPQTSKIDYLIRFQNTGNHVAYRVRVVDSVSENLPMTKILLKTASHSYELQVNDNVLTWTFNNIMLRDSITDEPNSHGYINYAAFIKPGLAIGTKITNKAYIYFDYQLPIVTKSTINIITNQDDIEETTVIGNQDYKVFPNPASGKLNILFFGKNLKQQLYLMNSLGQIITSIPIKSGEREEIDVSKLPNGLYLIRDIKRGSVSKIIVNH